MGKPNEVVFEKKRGVNIVKQRKRLWFHREEGQAIVEAALVIPLFILILCGILDFGWIFFNQLKVNNCSREGARYAIVNSELSDLSSAVTSDVRSEWGMSDSDTLSVAVEIINNEDIRVTVTKNVKVLTPIAGIFVPNQEVDVQSTSIMRIS